MFDSSTDSKDTRIYKVLQKLVAQEWITLSGMAVLLGLSNATSLYQRYEQHKNTGTEKEIQAIQVGKQYRIYEDNVIKLLENELARHNNYRKAHIKLVMNLYRSIKNVSIKLTSKSESGE